MQRHDRLSTNCFLENSKTGLEGSTQQLSMGTIQIIGNELLTCQSIATDHVCASHDMAVRGHLCLALWFDEQQSTERM